MRIRRPEENDLRRPTSSSTSAGVRTFGSENCRPCRMVSSRGTPIGALDGRQGGGACAGRGSGGLQLPGGSNWRKNQRCIRRMLRRSSPGPHRGEGQERVSISSRRTCPRLQRWSGASPCLGCPTQRGRSQSSTQDSPLDSRRSPLSKVSVGRADFRPTLGFSPDPDWVERGCRKWPRLLMLRPLSPLEMALRTPAGGWLFRGSCGERNFFC